MCFRYNMNKKNKFLLAGDKLMSNMHLKQAVLLNYLLKTKKRYKNLKKQEIQDMFTQAN